MRVISNWVSVGCVMAVVLASAFIPADAASVSAVSVVDTAITVDDFYNVASSETTTIGGPGLLGNDQAPDGAAVLLVNSVAHGSIGWDSSKMKPGEFWYTPPVGYVGFDTFTYCLTLSGATCESNTSRAVLKVGDPAVSRIAGSDRYEGAARIAQATNPNGSPVVFVVSGETYPDALSAAPAAGRLDAALLLVTSSGVPAATASELQRLKPQQVVVVGGPVSVPGAVADTIAQLLPAGSTVTRIGGVDRYAVSRAVATHYFDAAQHAFVATGTKYPDALTAGAAAVRADEPVVLVNGTASSVDAETQGTLLDLGTSAVTIVGGPSSVSTDIEAVLGGISKVDRVAGADRYAVAAALAMRSGGPSQTAFVSTGLNFPDALVGGLLAGGMGAPLFLAPGACVPTPVFVSMTWVRVRDVVLLGGESSLGGSVMELRHC